MPRIGRVLIARGRDATDVAISNTFGPNTLVGLQGLDGRSRESTDAVERRRAPADRAARHGLSLLGAGAAWRASHDVSPAREPRSSARQHEARHPARSPASLRWLHDVFDNSVAIATFDGATRGAAFRQHRHAGASRNGAARLCARDRRADLSVLATRTTTARSRAARCAPLSGRRGEPLGRAVPVASRIDRHDGAARRR